MRTRDTDKVELVKQKAMELVVSEGFEGFSMNKLAKACGISVATLYIYYKDKDDLIIQIAMEQGKLMSDTVLDGLETDMPFEAGLRKQWENRAKYTLNNRIAMKFFEQLRSSTYQEKILPPMTKDFKDVLGKFLNNAIARGEINRMPIEVYWSVAIGPLYSLLRFHGEGKSIGGKSFTISDKIIWETFDLVIKGLKK